MLAENSKKYIVGFHIFDKKKGIKEWMSMFISTKNWKVYQVKYRKVVARGLQNGGECTVAKEIYVIKEV